MSKTLEEWRPVVGYEGLYEVSDWGNVRSLDRTVFQFFFLVKKKTERLIKGEIKAKHNDKDGYEMVNLKKNGKHSTKKVHRLVAEAFIPNPESKPQVGHKDCNRKNNNIENLYWCTSKENNSHPITRKRLSESLKKAKNHKSDGTAPSD